MPADVSPLDLPPDPELAAPEGTGPPPAGASHRLATLFLVVVGLLVLLGAVPAASAVDALLANPAQDCGGP